MAAWWGGGGTCAAMREHRGAWAGFSSAVCLSFVVSVQSKEPGALNKDKITYCSHLAFVLCTPALGGYGPPAAI